MDLIYTNPALEDIGVLREYELDLAFGADENNFECTIQANAHCCEAGSFLYFEGTEYGGIIDGIQSDSSTNEIVYSGRTWHGILNSKVIEPDSGADYLIVSGEANTVIGALINRLKLSDMYEASSENSGLTINKYQMHRYITGYDGITKMLDSVGARIRLVFQKGKVILSAVPKHDFSQDEEFNTDQIGFRIKKNYRAVNHLICLGSGQLSDRLVVHLYVDKDGNISRTQTQFGMSEVSSIYEYSSISTEEELVKEGTAQLKSLNESEEVSIDFDADADIYDVGDVIGAYDTITGLYISTKIAKKIVTIKNGLVTISLSPDTAKTGSAMEVGGSVVIEGGSGGSDGSDGVDGKDGFSPTVDVTETTDGYTIAITDKDGTETVKLQHGKDGKDGQSGSAGKDGVSCTHSWNGTTLTVTSASGTSSANLKGEKGDTGAAGKDGSDGAKGETGAAGKDGADGVSITGATINSSGHLIITLSNGNTIDCGAVVTNGGDGGAYLPLTGGDISGNLSISGILSAITDQPIEIGRYIDFHRGAGHTGDYSGRLYLNTSNGNLLWENTASSARSGTVLTSGIIGDFACKVQSGTYVGTETKGSANALSLTFESVPKLVLIVPVGATYFGVFAPSLLTSTYKNYGYLRNGDGGSYDYAKMDGNTLSWYSTGGYLAQLNSADTYRWIAFG